MANPLSATIPTFRLNGNSIPIPSEHKWNLPPAWGIDGSGRERLYPFASVELTWNAITYNDYTDLYEIFLGSSSGSANAMLPSLYGDSFTYRVYSGVIFDTPRIEGSNLDGSNLLNVKMKIRKVTILRTS
jgi:hypothetical protein